MSGRLRLRAASLCLIGALTFGAGNARAAEQEDPCEVMCYVTFVTCAVIVQAGDACSGWLAGCLAGCEF